MDDDRPPICPGCGVTMVPAALSAQRARGGDWVCLECEEAGEPDAIAGRGPAGNGPGDRRRPGGG